MEQFTPVQAIQGPGPATGSVANLGSGWAALMDEVAYGIIMVDLNGRVVQANRAARHLMEQSAALRCGQGRLKFSQPENDAGLRCSLARAAQGKRSLIELSTAEGPSLSLAVLPLRIAGVGEPTHAALFFERTSLSDSVTLCLFARNHRLTPAEEEVMRILCRGLSAPEIACQLKVAVSTVRSHIRSVCTKTACKSVRELVARIAGLPPVGPALTRHQIH